MKTSPNNQGRRVTSEQQVELFFALIQERQNLEEEYYSTRNQALVKEIDKARERIREVMKDIVIRHY